MIEKTTLVILRLDRGIQRSRHWIARSSRAMTHFLLSYPDAEHRGILLIKYNFSDHIWAALGANIFGGGEKWSQFGQLDRNDNVYLQMRYKF